MPPRQAAGGRQCRRPRAVAPECCWLFLEPIAGRRSQCSGPEPCRAGSVCLTCIASLAVWASAAGRMQLAFSSRWGTSGVVAVPVVPSWLVGSGLLSPVGYGPLQPGLCRPLLQVSCLQQLTVCAAVTLHCCTATQSCDTHWHHQALQLITVSSLTMHSSMKQQGAGTGNAHTGTCTATRRLVLRLHV